ncbi:hypothetical protein LZC95_44310 [Pendulispora brunnea]|uniref:Uncharacterized protein n=1 Tax=Pendulispora brunnea TaxID=2905690 RepID=A0ABZ2K439_9BACT
MTAPRRTRWIRLAALAVASLVSACGSSKPKLSAQGVTHSTAPANKGGADSMRGKPELESYLVATVPERTLGPYLARRDGTAMVGYIASEGAARKVVAAPIAASNGKPSANARVVATANGDVDMLVLRPTGGARPGYVALWTSLTDRGKAIQLVGVADDGNARGQVIEVTRTTDNVVWVEVVPTARGAICVWAEETRDSSANIFGVPLDSDGRPRGVPTPLAKGVIGWQAVATTMGAGLALVSREAGQKPSLLWTKLDGDARAVGAPEVIAARSFVGSDVDVVPVGDAWVFAWTDRSGFDPQIMTVSLDERASSKEKVRTPMPAVTAIGGAKLVGLVSLGDAAALAWDESGRTGRSGRLHVAKMDAAGKLAQDAAVTLELEGNAVPVLAPAGRGVGLLVNARACPLKSSADACAAVSPGPTFLRLDEKFAPVQVETMRLREQRDAALAWGLDCGGKEARECLALAAVPLQDGAPGVSQVHAAHVAARTSLYKAPLVPPLPPDAPRPVSLTTVAAREAFTDLAAARAGDGTLLALVSSPPAMDKRDGGRKPAGSKQPPAPPTTIATGDTIRLYDLDAKGATRDKPALLTNRALSVGGVAIASDGNDGAAVAWVARDGGDPQVHLARVDRHGKKLREQQVTNDRGDASDVAVGWVKNGWIVAWVDGKDGNGEVYAARVSPELRVSPPERVTRAPGDASDLSMLVQGDRVWLAFSDPRDSPHDGFADVYVATLRASDAKRTSEVRVLATAAHSRSPVLAPAGDGVAVGWIEEAPMGTEPNNSAAYGAMVAWLDASGQPVREPVRTAGMGPGFPTAIAFQNVQAQGPLRAILARSTRDELSLDAVELPPNPATSAAPVRVFPLIALSGPPSLDISLAFLEGALFYSDGLPEEERVRRLTIGWK